MFEPEENQRVAQRLRNEYGLEMTPAEVEQLGREAFATVRASLLAEGFRVPESNEGLRALLWQEMIVALAESVISTRHQERRTGGG